MNVQSCAMSKLYAYQYRNIVHLLRMIGSSVDVLQLALGVSLFKLSCFSLDDCIAIVHDSVCRVNSDRNFYL